MRPGLRAPAQLATVLFLFLYSTSFYKGTPGLFQRLDLFLADQGIFLK